MASEANPTPGPWTVIPCCSSVGTEYAVESDLRCVADEIETLADACLIAAAPELLAALKYLIPKFVRCAQAHGNSDEVIKSNLEEVRAAIAKAEGRS